MSGFNNSTISNDLNFTIYTPQEKLPVYYEIN